MPHSFFEGCYDARKKEKFIFASLDQFRKISVAPTRSRDRHTLLNSSSLLTVYRYPTKASQYLISAINISIALGLAPRGRRERERAVLYASRRRRSSRVTWRRKSAWSTEPRGRADRQSTSVGARHPYEAYRARSARPEDRSIEPVDEPLPHERESWTPLLPEPRIEQSRRFSRRLLPEEAPRERGAIYSSRFKCILFEYSWESWLEFDRLPEVSALEEEERPARESIEIESSDFHRGCENSFEIKSRLIATSVPIEPRRKVLRNPIWKSGKGRFRSAVISRTVAIARLRR